MKRLVALRNSFSNTHLLWIGDREISNNRLKRGSHRHNNSNNNRNKAILLARGKLPATISQERVATVVGDYWHQIKYLNPHQLMQSEEEGIILLLKSTETVAVILFRSKTWYRCLNSNSRHLTNRLITSCRRCQPKGILGLLKVSHGTFIRTRVWQRIPLKVQLMLRSKV